jgi:hypothetical protein
MFVRPRFVAFVLSAVAASSSALAVGCSQSLDDEVATGVDAVSATERAAIMDALRAEVRPELNGQDIVFNVSQGTFRVKDGWCWLEGSIELRGGGQPTTRGTIHEDYDDGGDRLGVEAFLKKENGRWKAVTFGIASTDAWWELLAEDYPQAPREIFPWLDSTPDREAAAAQAERRAIMDALRARVSPELGLQDIVFNVSRGTFRTDDGWCWLEGNVELRGGGVPVTGGTLHEDYHREGDPLRVEALLKKENGRWVVLEHGVASTDAWWDGIAERYPGLPLSLFPDLQ